MSVGPLWFLGKRIKGWRDFEIPFGSGLCVLGCSVRVQAGEEHTRKQMMDPLIPTGQAWGRVSTPWALEYKSAHGRHVKG